ncbi:MAG: GNAT family N-acetyltransferase [Thermotogota bacterium]
MIIKKLTKDYKKDLQKYFKIFFNTPFEDEETKDEVFFGNDDLWKFVWGAFEEEKLVSTYISFDVDIKIRQKWFKGHYLDGLGTLPGYRNKGYIKQMTKNDFNFCYENNIPLILLDPFKHSYYEKFGFKTSFTNNQLELPFQLLKSEFIQTGYSLEIDFINENEKLKNDKIKLFEKIQEYSRYNEMKMASPYDKSVFLNKKQLLCVVYDGKEPKGYMVCEKEKRTLKIYNLKYTDLKSLFELRNLLISFKDQMNNFSFTKLPPDFPYEIFIDSYYGGGNYSVRKLFETRMMRIIKPEIMLEKIAKLPEDFSIKLKINDDMIPQNNKTFLINKNGLKETDQKQDLTIDIRNLSQMITGYKSPKVLYREGKFVEFQDIDLLKDVPQIIENLEKIFPPEITFTGEEF